MLDGVDDYVKVAASSSLSFSDQLTIAFWLRSTSDPTLQPRLLSHPGGWYMKMNGPSPQFSNGDKLAIAKPELPVGDIWERDAVEPSGWRVEVQDATAGSRSRAAWA